MLDAELKEQLKAYLERITQPIELVASLDGSAASAATAARSSRSIIWTWPSICRMRAEHCRFSVRPHVFFIGPRVMDQPVF